MHQVSIPKIKQHKSISNEKTCKSLRNNEETDQFHNSTIDRQVLPILDNNPTCSHKESRHVRVEGILFDVSTERISSFFAQFGRIHKITSNEKLTVVSFTDVRSAQKAYLCNSKFEGHHLKLYYHDLSNSNHMKNEISSDFFDSKNSRPSSAMSSLSSERRLSTSEIKEKKKSCTQNRFFNIDKISSIDQQISAHSVDTYQENIIEENTKNTIRSDEKKEINLNDDINSKDNIKSNDSVISFSNLEKYHEDQVKQVNGGLLGIYVSPLSIEKHDEFLRSYLTDISNKYAKVIYIQFSINYSSTSTSKKALILFQNVNQINSLLSRLCNNDLGNLKAVLADHVSVTEAHNDYLAKTCEMVAGISLPTKYPVFDVTPPLPDGTSPSSPLNKIKAQEKNKSSSKMNKILYISSNYLSENIKSSTLSNNSNNFISQANSSSSMYGSSINLHPLHKNASRTLYVGNLERKVTDDSLKTKFGLFGCILDVDVKNRDTPSPFAFIQFTNINSVVAAIRACNPNKSSVLFNSSISASSNIFNSSEANTEGFLVSSSNIQKTIKTNWGKSICSNKLWIGCLPNVCSEKYLFSKMKIFTPNDIINVIYDSNFNETIIIFKTNEVAQIVYNKIKNKILTFTPEKSSVEDFMHVHIDFCSEKLYDYFVDRKFCRFNNIINDKDNQKETTDTESNYFSKETNVTENSLIVNDSSLNLINSSICDDSLLLAPPPDPPKTFPVNKNYSHIDLSSNNNIHTSNIILSDSFLSSDKTCDRIITNDHSHKSLSELSLDKLNKHQKKEKNYEKISVDRTREKKQRSFSLNNGSNSKKKSDCNEFNSHRHNQSSSRNNSLDNQTSLPYTSFQDRHKIRNRGKRDNSSFSSSLSSESDESNSFDSLSSSEVDYKQEEFKRLYTHRWHRSKTNRLKNHKRSYSSNNKNVKKNITSDDNSNAEIFSKRICDVSSSSLSSLNYDRSSHGSSLERVISKIDCKKRKSEINKEFNNFNSKYASHLCPPPPMPLFKQEINTDLISFERRKLNRNRCTNRDSSSCSTSSNNSNVSNKKEKLFLENTVLQKNEFNLSKSNVDYNIIQFPKFKDNKSISKSVICNLSNKSKLTIPSVNQHRTSLEMRLHDLYGSRQISTTSNINKPENFLSTNNLEEKTHLKLNCNASNAYSINSKFSAEKSIDYLNNKNVSNTTLHSQRNTKKSNQRLLVKVPTNIPLNAETHALFIDGLIDPRNKKTQLINSTNYLLNLPLLRFATDLVKVTSVTEKKSPLLSQKQNLILTQQLQEKSDDNFNKIDVLNNDLIMSPIKTTLYTNNLLNDAESNSNIENEANILQNINAINSFTDLEKNASQTKSDYLNEMFSVARSLSTFTSSNNLAKRLNDLKKKINIAQENIQKTKSIASIFISRKPTSIEQELERLQSKKSISDDSFINNNINSLNCNTNKKCALPINSLSSANLKTKDLSNLQNNNLNNNCNFLLNNHSFASNSGSLEFPRQDNDIININKLEDNKTISEKNSESISKEDFTLSVKCGTSYMNEIQIEANSLTNNFKEELLTTENIKKCDVKSSFQNQQNDVSLSTTHSFNRIFNIYNSNNKEKTSRPKIDNLFRQQAKNTKKISAFSKEDKKKSENDDNSSLCFKSTSLIFANSTDIKEKIDFKSKVEKKDIKDNKDQKENKERKIDNNIANKASTQSFNNKEKEKNNFEVITKVNDRLLTSSDIKDKNAILSKKEDVFINSSVKEKTFNKHDRSCISKSSSTNEEKPDKSKKKKFENVFNQKNNSKYMYQEKQKLRDYEKIKKQHQKKKSSIISSENDSDNSLNIDFCSTGVDIEKQHLIMQEIKACNYGISMYDRVKRRSSAAKPEKENKKLKSLEKFKKKKKFNRIQLSSSGEENFSDDRQSNFIKSDINDSEDNSNIENKYKNKKKELLQASTNNNSIVCSNMNSSADSNNSNESDSDSNHDTSTDGEPYMKNLRKKLSQYRSSSNDENDSNIILKKNESNLNKEKAMKSFTPIKKEFLSFKKAINSKTLNKINYFTIDGLYENDLTANKNKESLDKNFNDDEIYENNSYDKNFLIFSKNTNNVESQNTSNEVFLTKELKVDNDILSKEKNTVKRKIYYSDEDNVKLKLPDKKKFKFVNNYEISNINKNKKRLADYEKEKNMKRNKKNEDNSSNLSCKLNDESFSTFLLNKESITQNVVSELGIKSGDSLLNQNHATESVNISIKTAKYFNSPKTNLNKNNEKLNLKQKSKQLKNNALKLQSSNSSSSNSLSDSSSSSSDEEENKCSSFSFFTSTQETYKRNLTEKDQLNSNSFDTSICLEVNKSNNFKELDNLKTEDLNLTLNQKTNDLNVNVSISSNIEKCINSKNKNLNNSNQSIFKEDNYNFLKETKINKNEDNFEIIEQGKINFKSINTESINDFKEINKSSDNLSSNKDSNFYLNTIFENSSKNVSKITNLLLNSQNKKDQIAEKNIFSQNKKTEEEDYEKFKDELLQKMREEEETAVMNLTDFGCFGTSYSNNTNKFTDSSCTDKIPINSVHLTNKKEINFSYDLTKDKNLNKNESENSAQTKENFNKTCVDLINYSDNNIIIDTHNKSQINNNPIDYLNDNNKNEIYKCNDLDLIDKQISNEIIDNSGGYMEIDAKYLLRQQEQEEKEKEEQKKKNKIEEELKIDSVVQDENFQVVTSCYLEMNTSQNISSVLSKSSPLLSFVSTSNISSNFQIKDNSTTDSNHQVQKIDNQESKVSEKNQFIQNDLPIQNQENAFKVQISQQLYNSNQIKPLLNLSPNTENINEKNMVTNYVNEEEKSSQQSQYFNEIEKFVKNSQSNDTSEVNVSTSLETFDEILSQSKTLSNKIIDQNQFLAKSLSLNQIENSKIQEDYCQQQLQTFKIENKKYSPCKLNENFPQQDQLQTENNDQLLKSQLKEHSHLNLQKTEENQSNLQTNSHTNQSTEFLKNQHLHLKIDNCSLIQTQLQNPQIFVSEQKNIHFLDQSQLNSHSFHRNELETNLHENFKKKQQAIFTSNEISQKQVSILPEQINVEDSTKINFKNYQNTNVISCTNSKSPENNLSSVFQTTQSTISNLSLNQLQKDNKQTFNKELKEQNQQRQLEKNNQYSNQNLFCKSIYKEPQQQFSPQQKTHEQNLKYHQIFNQTQVKVLQQSNFADELTKVPVSLDNSNLSTTSQLAKFLQNPNLLHNLNQEQITSLLSGTNTGNNNSHNLVEVFGINSGNKIEHQTKFQQSKNQNLQQQLSRSQSVLSTPLHLEQSNQQSTVQLQRPLSNLAVTTANPNSNILVPNVSTNSDLNNDSSVNAQLIALYNRFNLINSPLLHQNAAAIYARTFNPNISSLQKNWSNTTSTSSQKDSFQSITNPSLNSSQIFNTDAEPMELLRHKAAQQLQNYSQVIQKQNSKTNSNTISGNTSITDIQSSYLLQQHNSIKNSAMLTSQQNQDHQKHIFTPQQQTSVVQQNYNKLQNTNTVLNSFHPHTLSNFAEQQLQQQVQIAQRHVNDKYPIVWQGQLSMKTTDTLVQLHRVCGNERFLELTAQELESRVNNIKSIRITQRMRLETFQLESLTRKMEKEENYISLVCFPCGRNQDDITSQTDKMKKYFIEYFTEKMAAGIINQGPISGNSNSSNSTCVAHVFPPSSFAISHLTRYAPDFWKAMKNHPYLFIVITYTG